MVAGRVLRRCNSGTLTWPGLAWAGYPPEVATELREGGTGRCPPGGAGCPGGTHRRVPAGSPAGGRDGHRARGSRRRRGTERIYPRVVLSWPLLEIICSIFVSWLARGKMLSAGPPMSPAEISEGVRPVCRQHRSYPGLFLRLR
jgi:hypothetical protein